jgi:hypothetical protein
MPYPISTCRCKNLEAPMPRFCRDDLFCPQCGKSVAWIDSDHFLPAPEPGAGDSARPIVWVYRVEDSEGHPTYELALEFFELDPSAEKRPRYLELDAEGCSFQAAGFDTTVKVRRAGSSGAIVQLIPLSPNDPPPIREVPGRLRLSGNCGVPGQVLAGRPGDRDGLDVLILNAALFRTVVLGEGVQEEADSKDTWQLWIDGPQDLTIQFQPTEAPVYLDAIDSKSSWPIEEDLDPPVRLLERPEPKTIYGPGRPLVVAMKLDPTKWEAQESKTLRLQVKFALRQVLDRSLKFKRQAEGMLVWSTGNELIVPPMFYGETVVSPPTSALLPEITVSNAATTSLPAQVPRIGEGASLPGVRWIDTGWADGTETSDTLHKDEKKGLRLLIDLSQVDPGNHPKGNPLKAEVVVQHSNFGMRWKLGVTIKSVGHRPPLEAPLALDFGNTNSYGSAELPGRQRNDPMDVRSVLVGDTDDPETFASALAFRDFDDNEHPDYVIGREALEFGKEQPLRLERGLKRELSMLRPVANEREEILGVDHPRHPFNQRRFIYPREGGSPVQYSLRELVRFYILAAIARCETSERRTVTQLGLSYPANLGPEPRRALNLVLEDVEAECRARHPELADRISFRKLGPDEASAVALGFVLDPKTLRQRIMPLFEGDNAEFVLASFDFGGGSIDIALIRFVLDGRPPLTTFSSALLGLGGDEHFGGDNVTVAAYEILASRIAKALGPQTTLALARLDLHRNRAEPRSWTNRQALWIAAEAAKRAVCRGVFSLARTEIASALEGLHPDDRASLDVIKGEIVAGRLDLTLEELYDHVVVCDLSGMGNYSVSDRLKGCVAMLREYADRAGSGALPKFLVLAGAACRVPLARELLEKEFPHAEIIPEAKSIPDTYRPKSKVADGLARFLKASRGGAADPRVRGLKAADQFTHADLLWINPVQSSFPVVWVRSCAELSTKDWHRLQTDEETPRVIRLEHAWSRPEVGEIDIHRRASPEPELVGTARLARPAEILEAGVSRELPPPSPELDQAEVLLRIDGEEDNLRLRIRINGAEFGDWKVQPGATRS